MGLNLKPSNLYEVVLRVILWSVNKSGSRLHNIISTIMGLRKEEEVDHIGIKRKVDLWAIGDHFNCRHRII